MRVIDLIRSLIAVLLVAISGAIGLIRSEEASPPPYFEPSRRDKIVVEPTTTTTTTIQEYLGEGGPEPTTHYLSSTTTSTTTPLPEGKCSEWYQHAVDVGWPEERLQKLGRIMWAESRCLPDVRGSGSYGLTQMQYSAHKDWLLEEFGVRESTELYEPYLNLASALWLAEYAEVHYGCWAQPWYMSGDWC